MALTSSPTRPTRRTGLPRLSHPPMSGLRPLLDLKLRGCELSFVRRTLCRRVDTSRTLSNVSSLLVQARPLRSNTMQLAHQLESHYMAPCVRLEFTNRHSK